MNTIKTKIGFETKPYVIQTLYFDELFNFSVKTYGRVLLLAAILLSASNWFYLNQIQHQKTDQLQSLQQEAIQLEKEHSSLIMQHNILSSTDRLKSIASQVNMSQPSEQTKIYLPQNNT